MPYPSQCFAKAAIAHSLECIHIETSSRSYVWAQGFLRAQGFFTHSEAFSLGQEVFHTHGSFSPRRRCFSPSRGVFHICAHLEIYQTIVCCCAAMFAHACYFVPGLRCTSAYRPSQCAILDCRKISDATILAQTMLGTIESGKNRNPNPLDLAFLPQAGTQSLP